LPAATGSTFAGGDRLVAVRDRLFTSERTIA
jgi:hypothetical protein